jgi:hypothetical protein
MGKDSIVSVWYLVHATPFCTNHSLHVLFERESDNPPLSWEDPQHIMWLRVCTF